MPVKIAILDSADLSPPIKAEILTIDVSTIKAITMKHIIMKILLVPSLRCIQASLTFLCILFKPGPLYDRLTRGLLSNSDETVPHKFD